MQNSEKTKKHLNNTIRNVNMQELIIENGVLTECKSSKESIVIPQGVTEIGKNAFAGKKTLVKVVLPNTLTKISDNAFSSCYNLQYIFIPKSVTCIGDRAFNGCLNVRMLIFEEGSELCKIGNKAFGMCQGIKYTELPPSVLKIGRDVFWLTFHPTIFIPSKKLSLSTRSFHAGVIAEMPEISPRSLPESCRMNAVRGYFSLKERKYPIRDTVEKRYIEFIKSALPDIIARLSEFSGTNSERRKIIMALCKDYPMSRSQLSKLIEISKGDAELISILINCSRGCESELDSLEL